MKNFGLSIFAGMVASILVLLGQFGWKFSLEWMQRRYLRWLWSEDGKILPRLRGQRAVAVTFSLLELDEPIHGRSTRITASHIGDAQAAALMQKVLEADLKRSTDLWPGDDSLAESRDRDIICIGGPAFNASTKQLISAYEQCLPVVFKQKTNGEYYFVETARPQATYSQTVENQRTVEDWALVLKLPQLKGQSIGHDTSFCLILAGLSTFGTLAAAKFATDNGWLKKMRKKLRAKGKGGPFFCALLRTWPKASYLDVADIKLHDEWWIKDPWSNVKK